MSMISRTKLVITGDRGKKSYSQLCKLNQIWH